MQVTVIALVQYGGVTMPRDKSISHEKIVQAAKAEFAEYGYRDASMRRIGHRCGLTAAALYRHFESKEAMFEALVGPAVRDMDEWIEMRSADFGEQWKRAEIAMMTDLIYPRMEEYSMLINKSAGSGFENFLDELIDDQQQRMIPYIQELKSQGVCTRDISEEELHILLTAYCTALFEPIAHEYTYDQAVKYLATVEEFFKPGWESILGC